MTERSAFDHRPDAELGRELRAVLSLPDDEAFAARVLAAVGTGRPEAAWWEVLTSWARPGLVAAGLLAVAALAWVAAGPRQGLRASLEDPLPAAGEGAAVPTYLVSAEAPDVNAVMAAFVEEER
jgi:hypothetical protein